MKKAWVLSYPLNAQRSLYSDWADALADLRWAHTHSVGFVISWLISHLACILTYEIMKFRMSVDSEISPSEDDGKETEHLSRAVFLKILFLSFVGCIYYFAVGLHSYTVGEWTQQQVKIKHFHKGLFQPTFLLARVRTKVTRIL